ncbi:tripartite tricarboxylate transporter TctB family protein [Halomonas ventosae]|uniref:tripartite tricarboxylate transporter TctB family protein n=1 Tax=Halomonas ventosae TaxID=229007 RepID=UPI001061044E
MATKDRYLSTIILIFVAILLLESANISGKTSWQPYGSALFPRLLLITIGALSLLLLIKSFIKPSNDFYKLSIYSIKINLKEKKKIIAIFVLCGLYVYALPHAGYLSSTISFMLISQAVLMGVNTKAKLITILATSFSLTPGIYFIFQHGLNIWLP